MLCLRCADIVESGPCSTQGTGYESCHCIFDLWLVMLRPLRELVMKFHAWSSKHRAIKAFAPQEWITPRPRYQWKFHCYLEVMGVNVDASKGGHKFDSSCIEGGFLRRYRPSINKDDDVYCFLLKKGRLPDKMVVNTRWRDVSSVIDDPLHKTSSLDAQVFLTHLFYYTVFRSAQFYRLRPPSVARLEGIRYENKGFPVQV